MALDLKPTLNLIERIIKTALRAQAPVKTGALQKSVQVKAVLSEDGVKFTPTFLRYGTYLNQGTGRYKVKETKGRPFNPNPGKGTMGIKPRFWLNIQATTMQAVNKILYKEIAKQIRQEFRTRK